MKAKLFLAGLVLAAGAVGTRIGGLLGPLDVIRDEFENVAHKIMEL